MFSHILWLNTLLYTIYNNYINISVASSNDDWDRCHRSHFACPSIRHLWQTLTQSQGLESVTNKDAGWAEWREPHRWHNKESDSYNAELWGKGIKQSMNKKKSVLSWMSMSSTPTSISLSDKLMTIRNRVHQWCTIKAKKSLRRADPLNWLQLRYKWYPNDMR